MLASSKHKIKILMVNTFFPQYIGSSAPSLFCYCYLDLGLGFVCLFCFFERSYYASPLDLELTM